MASKKRRNTKARASGNPARQNKAGARAKPRRSDFPGLFRLADELVTSARAVLAAPSGAQTLARFDEVQLERGIGAVEAVMLLIERGHWRFASGIARQLFEQLVNVEYLAAQPDRLQAVTSYAKFGLMQQIAQSQAEVEYVAETNRRVDEEFRKLLKAWLELNFDEFKGKPKSDGTMNLNSSWSGKNLRQLTESSRNAMRGKQYELLFKVWSTQVHAAPAAMTDGLFGVDSSTVDLAKQDLHRAAELLATVLNLFIDLWKNLPNVQQPSLPETLALLDRLHHELGRVIDLSGYQPPSQAWTKYR